MKKPRQGPTPVGQRLRAQTIPAKRHPGPHASEWFDEDTPEHFCLVCDKSITRIGVCIDCKE